jgi:hypothetical protein
MADEYFDLIVWYEHDGSVHGFQLCYDKSGRERSLTWTLTHGARHDLIDTGEERPTANHTPTLLTNDDFPAEAVRRQFLSRSTQIKWTDQRSGPRQDRRIRLPTSRWP